MHTSHDPSHALPTRSRGGVHRRARPAARVHGRNLLALACLAAGVSGSMMKVSQAPQRPRVAGTTAPVAQPVARAAPVPAPVVAAVAETTPPAELAVALAPAEPARLETVPATAPAAAAADDYYERLRARLRWVPVRVGGREIATPDAASRLLLVRSAAERAGLAEVGLDYRDVYGVINAETTWVSRTGMGRNGVASYGLAQFEPATAKALGVRDAEDPVEAVHAAATLLKEAAQWSARRIAGLGLGSDERAARLREGVSIYYNLSSRARQRWDGLRTAHLPVETQRHIRNVRLGAQQAERLQAGDGGIDVASLVKVAARPQRDSAAPAADAVRRAGAARAPAPKPSAPQPLGTIAWSGNDASDARTGRHVVWSNGAVTREGGRVQWTGASAKQPG